MNKFEERINSTSVDSFAGLNATLDHIPGLQSIPFDSGVVTVLATLFETAQSVNLHAVSRPKGYDIQAILGPHHLKIASVPFTSLN